jgi:ribosomal protein L16/L10AE
MPLLGYWNRQQHLLLANDRSKMKSPFLLSFLAVSILLSGCSSSTKKPAELALEPQSQYDQRIQDGLGSQRYTEAQILYQRRMSEFSREMEKLERQRKTLENGLNNAAYENGFETRPASLSEETRIAEYQDAALKSQAKIAQSETEVVVQRAILENKRDTEILEAERQLETQVADIEREFAQLVNMAEQGSREMINARTQQEQAIQHETEALRNREAALLDSQRFELAVANAEQVKTARSALTSAQADLATSTRQYEVEIAELEARLTALRAQADLSQSQKSVAVASAASELKRLVEVGEMLKTKSQPQVASLSPLISPAYQQFLSDQERRLADQKADLERRKLDRIAQVRSKFAAERNLISSRTRTEIAGLESVATIKKSSVVAPVVTGRKVYTGEPAKNAGATASSSPAVAKPFAVDVKTPVTSVTSFMPALEPKKEGKRDVESVVLAGGTSIQNAVAGAPVVEEPKTREVYDVLYVYRDQDSWQKFQKYLRAYGIDDFLASRNNAKGEWYVYAGRFYDTDAAARRVDELNRKTHTSHAKVIKKEIPL